MTALRSIRERMISLTVPPPIPAAVGVWRFPEGNYGIVIEDAIDVDEGLDRGSPDSKRSGSIPVVAVIPFGTPAATNIV
jgi:hypothetical protein